MYLGMNYDLKPQAKQVDVKGDKSLNHLMPRHTLLLLNYPKVKS